jgi:Zn-dependent metalloprotease
MRRSSRPKLPFKFSLLWRIMAVVAVAGVIFTQIFDKSPLDILASDPPAKPNAVTAASSVQEPCSELGESSLPKDAAIQRNPADGAIRQLKGANLSLTLEQNTHFRELQRNNLEAEIAMCFMQAYSKLFRLDAPHEELQPIVATPDELGFTHVRLRQLYAGLPIRNRELIVHLNAEKQVYQVDGSYHPTPSGLGTTPRISSQHATETAREALTWDHKTRRGYRTQVAVYVDRQNRALLAYQVIAYKGTADDWEIWVDANTGEILEKSAFMKPHL